MIELSADHIMKCVNAFTVGHIAGKRRSLSSQLANFTRDRLNQFRAASGGDYVGPRLREPLGQRQPNPRRAPNHHRNSSVQIKSGISHQQ